MSAENGLFDFRGEIAFVVLSCDRYADLWEPCIRRLRRHWADMPFDVYLVANYKEFHGPGVRTLHTGEDVDWSTTVRRALEQVPHPYVFFWFDDAFLNKRVRAVEVAGYLKWAIHNRADYLRLRDFPRPGETVAENIGRLVERVPYRNTCFASLWRREVFLEILRDGESAADFEMQGTRRSDPYPRFYGVNRCPIEYIHGVVRGVWLRSALRNLVSTGDVRTAERPVMSAVREAIWRLCEIKGAIVGRLPPGWAEVVFTIKRLAAGRSR